MKTFLELKKNIKKISSSLPVKKVALLGDSATQFLAKSICGTGVDRGYHLDIWEADYNQVELQLMNPTSELFKYNPDYIIVFHSTHKLLEKYNNYSKEEREKLADERIDFIKSICRENENQKIIYYNYPEIEDTVYGSYANKTISSFTYQVRKLNYELMNLSIQYPNLFICDIAGLQNKYGRNFMFNSNIYISTEMVLSIDSLPYIASRTVDIICAIEGKFKKCIILDLDNTLWGGIVGDDGWENIQIGHNIGIGKAFTEFQEWIKKLKERGIILAVCSKNDENKAKEAFEKNPEMVLKLDDIAIFIANWENKVNNIITIQKILNIGFDSMVFLDDNPFERNMVKENIPDITVPELPEDPGDYLEYLYSLNLFETISVSDNDKNRTKQYQNEAKRVELQKKFTNEADFLKSLEMVSDVEHFTLYNTPRVAQLSQRSNQFNLRTVRYTEQDIQIFAKENNDLCFSFSLKDKFGDNGIIAVIIMKEINPDTLFIDTWFMSCRVLKRGMENFTLNEIVNAAKKLGYKYIIGEYLPTNKNKLVENHYANLGFSELKDTQTKQYILNVEDYKERECYILKK